MKYIKYIVFVFLLGCSLAFSDEVLSEKAIKFIGENLSLKREGLKDILIDFNQYQFSVDQKTTSLDSLISILKDIQNQSDLDKEIKGILSINDSNDFLREGSFVISEENWIVELKLNDAFGDLNKRFQAEALKMGANAENIINSEVIIFNGEYISHIISNTLYLKPINELPPFTPQLMDFDMSLAPWVEMLKHGAAPNQRIVANIVDEIAELKFILDTDERAEYYFDTKKNYMASSLFAYNKLGEIVVRKEYIGSKSIDIPNIKFFPKFALHANRSTNGKYTVTLYLIKDIRIGDFYKKMTLKYNQISYEKNDMRFKIENK